MDEILSLKQLFKILKKRMFFIFIVVTLTVTLTGAVTYLLITPIYQASTQILINQSKTEQPLFTSQDIQTNLELINTYNEIIKSRVILTKVIDNMDLDLTTTELDEKITVKSGQNSQVVNIHVRDPELQNAVDIANTIVEVFQKEIMILMNVDNVNVLSLAVFEKKELPIKPSPILNIAIAVIIGLMFGIGIAFLLEHLDSTVKTEQDIEEILGLPVFGIVSPISEKAVQRTDVLSGKRKKKGEFKVV